MSLDVYLTIPACEHCGRDTLQVWSGNVTHNLGKMARTLGVYDAAWRPDEHGITKARQMIEPLNKAIAKLTIDPESYREHEADNGWGTIQWMAGFLTAYRNACVAHPDADVRASR
jgi:hypothetical protein